MHLTRDQFKQCCLYKTGLLALVRCPIWPVKIFWRIYMRRDTIFLCLHEIGQNIFITAQKMKLSIKDSFSKCDQKTLLKTFITVISAEKYQSHKPVDTCTVKKTVGIQLVLTFSLQSGLPLLYWFSTVPPAIQNLVGDY